MSQLVPTEADLLAIMADSPYHSPPAKQALGELYSRHVHYLFCVVRRAYGTVLDEDDIVDVVNDSFMRAYGWAYRHGRPAEVLKRFSAKTADEVRLRARAWLGAIAKHLVMTKLTERSLSASKLAQYLEQYPEPDETSVETAPSSTSKLLEAALASLSTEEREVVTVSLPWYDPATSQFQLPRGEAASIARKLGISPDHFRQRRHRALKHLRDFLRQAGISADADGGLT